MKGRTAMSENKNTKEFLIGNSHIFDNTHLDERQKADAYRITFKLFIALIYTMLILSMSVVFFTIGTPNTALPIAGTVVMIITQLFIVLYAAMTSAKGAMNLEFARKTSSPAYAVSLIALAVVLFLISLDGKDQRSRVNDILYLIYMFVYVVENLLLFYYSRRNMKVLEKQLKDDEENDE